MSVLSTALPAGERTDLLRLFAYFRARPELVLVLLLAAASRLVLIDAQSGWVDEAATLQTMHAGWLGIVRTQLNDIHPLLYFLLLHLWLKVSGLGLLQARLFSLLCDVATVAVLYSLARRLFDRPTATVTSVLFALSPVAVWYADTARMYALTELLSLLAIRLLVAAIDMRSIWHWTAFSVCAVLAVNADYSGAYLICAAALWYLLLVARGRAPLQPLLRSVGIMAVLLIPALLVLHRQTSGQNLQQLDWISAPTPSTVLATGRDLISQQAPDSMVVALVGGALAVLSAVMCSWDARFAARRFSYLLLACMILTPLVLALLASLIHPVFITRQVLTLLFGLLLVFARAIVLAWRQWRPVGALALAAIIVLNVSSLQVMAGTQIDEDWRDAVPYVLGHSAGKTLLVFSPFWNNTPFDLYAGRLKPEVQEVDSIPPVDTRQQPWPRFSTVWLIAVSYLDTSMPAGWYAAPGPFLPRGWPTRQLTLTDHHHFTHILLFRFSSR